MSNTANPSPTPKAEKQVLLLKCPICGQATDSLKCYTVMHEVLWLLIVSQWREVDYMACPTCMRKYLRQRVVANILTSHLLWPVWIFPPFLVKYLRSFTKGHSDAVIDALKDEQRQRRFAQQRAAQKEIAKRKPM